MQNQLRIVFGALSLSMVFVSAGVSVHKSFSDTGTKPVTRMADGFPLPPPPPKKPAVHSSPAIVMADGIPLPPPPKKPAARPRA